MTPNEYQTLAAPTQPPADLPPLDMEVTYRAGQVLLAFSRAIHGVHMTPHVTRQLIRQLSKAALEAARHKPGR